jgi:hypothetical protein
MSKPDGTTEPPWTRLHDSSLYCDAVALHGNTARKSFHNWDLICRVYEAAGTVFRYPYDRALDLAILSRTAHIGSCEERRDRAVSWLEARLGEDDPDLERAAALIGGSADFSLNPDPRLILVSLERFRHFEQSVQDVDRLRDEVVHLYNMDEKTFYCSFCDSLSRLRSTLGLQAIQSLDACERQILKEIRNGISALQAEISKRGEHI